MSTGGGPGFDGIPPAGFAFLRELAAHNDRAWFTPRKADYHEMVESPLRALAAAVAEALAARKVGLTCDPLKAVFRLHRDVRFSPDKRPYKTHAGAVLSRDGRKGGNGVLYLHIEPAGSFAACGFYQPDPATLAALRRALVARPARLQRVLTPLRQAGLDLSRDDALRRPPRGFEDAPAAVADVLRLRHLIVRHELEEARLTQPAVVSEIADFAAACRALLAFGWEVADGVAKP